MSLGRVVLNISWSNVIPVRLCGPDSGLRLAPPRARAHSEYREGALFGLPIE